MKNIPPPLGRYTKRIFCISAFSLLLLTGCADMLTLTAYAVADKVAQKQTGDVCIDDPFEAYAKNAQCRYEGSPIHTINVNDRGLTSSKGYCALEWALVYDREDIVKESLANGANPESCATNDLSLPFTRALYEVEAKHGTRRLHHYFQLLHSQRAIRKFDKSLLLTSALENDRVDFVKFAIDSGWKVNDKVEYKTFTKGGWQPRRKTLLYLAVEQLLTTPTLRTDETIKFLVASGAKVTPDIDEFMKMRQPPVPQEVVDRVNLLLSR